MHRNTKASLSYLLAFLLLSFFTLLLIDPQGVLTSGRKAVDLCLNIIVPSLFPFFVISRLVLNTEAIHTISRLFRPIIKPLFNLPGEAAFPIIAGWFSGYPAGAKYTTDLYNRGMISKAQAERLLAFCNNSGPLFIVGAVGTGYFNSPELGIVLLVCHLLASILVGIGAGILSRLKGNQNEAKEALQPREQKGFSGQILTEAIFDSIKVLLQISGTIIFFAVLVQVLETAGIFTFFSRLLSLFSLREVVYVETAKVFMAGCLEVTYGLYLLSASAGIPMFFRILLTAFLCGFGGLSVYVQVAGICLNHFSLKNYFYGKLVHGLIAALCTGLFMINRTTPVMTSTDGLYTKNTLTILLLVYSFILILGIFSIIRQWISQKKQ